MDATASDAAGINIELDKMLVTTMLSIILYGRQAFPENCFREFSAHELGRPLATHEHLLESGQPLSYRDDPLQTLSSDRDTLVYLRQRSNPRLHSLLANLDQIFAALADRLVGKIYICFNDTKKWSEDSLLECYTLKFAYTELGDLHAHAHWAGKGDARLKGKLPADFFKALKQVVLSCPPLPSQFYTRLFVCAVNKQTQLDGVWAGDGHGIREALSGFKDRQETGSLKIGMFTCGCPSRDVDTEASSRAATPDLPELYSSPTMGASPSDESDLNLAASPAGPSRMDPKKRPASPDQSVPATQTSRARTTVAAKHPRLAMIEEVPEDLSPTQRLKTPSQTRQARNPAFATPECLSTESEASPLAERNTSAVLGNTWETPKETEQASQSRSIQKANTARTYGGRPKPGGKRAHTMA